LKIGETRPANKSIHPTARAFFFKAGSASGNVLVEKATSAYHLESAEAERYARDLDVIQ